MARRSARIATARARQILAHATARHLCRHDARRYRKNAPAEQHDEARNRAAKIRLRHDVAEAHRSHRRNRPVHCNRNTGEAVPLSLDHVHHRAEEEHDNCHRANEHQDLAPARGERRAERAVLADVSRELEDTEHPQHAQQADVHQHLQRREEEREIRRQDRDQIDDAEEASRIASRPLDAQKPRDILDSKKQRERPFEHTEELLVAASEALHTVEHHHHDARDDRKQQCHVERLACWRVRLEDHREQLAPPPALRPTKDLGLG